MGDQNSFGFLKLKVADQITEGKCQEIQVLLGIAPAVCERTRSGLPLLIELESMGYLSERNVDQLIQTLKLVNLQSAVQIVETYKRQHNL